MGLMGRRLIGGPVGLIGRRLKGGSVGLMGRRLIGGCLGLMGRKTSVTTDVRRCRMSHSGCETLQDVTQRM